MTHSGRNEEERVEGLASPGRRARRGRAVPPLSWSCPECCLTRRPLFPQVFLWSMRSYTLIRKLEGHQSSVVSCDFSPDSALLVTASYDTSVIMWDPYTGERLRSLQ